MDGIRVSLAHLGISVYDFEKMVDFYTRVLGFVISDTGPLPGRDARIAFLTASPGDHHQLVIVEGRAAEDIPTAPPFGGSLGSQLFQLSFRLNDLATLRTIKAKFEAEGLTNFVPMNHGNAWAMYVRDPEGNALEFFLDTDWYVEQPCGMPLDLSKSDAEIYAETKEFCLSRPECLPMAEWEAQQRTRILATQAAAFA
jgi:catechol 2,3-dioxygenase